jgi:hypothetical protein
VTSEPRLLEDRHAITQNLESAATRRNQLHLFPGQRITNLRRQTGGAGLQTVQYSIVIIVGSSSK